MTTSEPAPAHALRNGVDTTALDETLDRFDREHDAPLLFQAINRWVSGTHTRTTVHAFAVDTATHEHVRRHDLDADLPTVLAGADLGPTPFEYLLQALAACLTSGIALAASMRGVHLDEVACTASGEVDPLGLLGRGRGPTNGVVAIDVHVRVTGDEPAALRGVVDEACRRSVVHAALTRALRVGVHVDAA